MNTEEVESLLWLLTYAIAAGTGKPYAALMANKAIDEYRASALYNEDPTPPEEWVDEDVPF